MKERKNQLNFSFFYVRKNQLNFSFLYSDEMSFLLAIFKFCTANHLFKYYSIKKSAIISKPYFPDLHSPQMISRKLMSLSEEAGAEEKKNRGKKGKETKRSASVSSHDFSPSSSPYLPAKHDNSKQVRIPLGFLENSSRCQ